MILRPVRPQSPLRPADDEAARRIDVKNRVFVEILGGNHGFDDAVDDRLA